MQLTADDIIDEASTLLPSLAPYQVRELDSYIQEGDLSAAQFLVRFWAKQYKEAL